MNKPAFKPGDVVLVNLPADNLYFSSMHGHQAQLVRKLQYTEGPRWVFRMLEGPYNNNGQTYRITETNLVPWRTYPDTLKQGGLPNL